MAKSNVNTLYTKMALFQDTFLFLNKQVYKKCNFPTYFYERKIPVEIVNTTTLVKVWNVYKKSPKLSKCLQELIT